MDFLFQFDDTKIPPPARAVQALKCLICVVGNAQYCNVVLRSAFSSLSVIKLFDFLPKILYLYAFTLNGIASEIFFVNPT